MDDIIKDISELINNFLISQGLNISIKGINIAVATILNIIPLPLVYKIVKYLYNRYVEITLNKDLHPFYTPLEIKKSTNYFIDTKCQNIPPSIEHEPRQTHAFATKEYLIPFFINKVFKNKYNDQRFYMILADSGMGKTTFMINLYQRYINKLINRKYKILLFPLGSPHVEQEFSKITDEEKKNTILLLVHLQINY